MEDGEGRCKCILGLTEVNRLRAVVVEVQKEREFKTWAASHPDGVADHRFVKNGGSHRRCRREAQM